MQSKLKPEKQSNQKPSPKPSKTSVGRQAEKLVASHLKSQGYKVIAYNFFTRFSEIDIIAQQGDCLVFVEVKARSSPRQGLPQEAVTPRKLQKLIKAAQWYLAQHQWMEKPSRIDVAAVDLSTSPPKINHLKNVTA